MTLPEKAWLVQNIQQDKVEESELLKTLCTFIRPEVFVEKTVEEKKRSVSTEISKELQSKTMLSPEELDMILYGDLDELQNYTPIDRVK